MAWLGGQLLRFTQSTRLITQRGTGARQEILPLFTQQGFGFVYSGDGDADIMVRRQRSLNQIRESRIVKEAPPGEFDISGTQPRRWLAEAGRVTGDGRRVIGAHRRTSG